MKSQARIPSLQRQEQPLHKCLHIIGRHLAPSFADDFSRKVTLAAGDILLCFSAYDRINTEVMAGTFNNADIRNTKAILCHIWFDYSRQIMFHSLAECGRKQP